MDNERLKVLLQNAITVVLTEVYGGETRQYLRENLGITDSELDELEIFDERD